MYVLDSQIIIENVISAKLAVDSNADTISMSEVNRFCRIVELVNLDSISLSIHKSTNDIVHADGIKSNSADEIVFDTVGRSRVSCSSYNRLLRSKLHKIVETARQYLEAEMLLAKFTKTELTVGDKLFMDLTICGVLANSVITGEAALYLLGEKPDFKENSIIDIFSTVDIKSTHIRCTVVDKERFAYLNYYHCEQDLRGLSITNLKETNEYISERNWLAEKEK